MPKTTVLFVLEGTYPFNGGGVSTWAHILCNRIQKVDFTLYSMNAQFEKYTRYELSPRIQQTIQVPLWSSFEPADFMEYGRKYKSCIEKRERARSPKYRAKFRSLFQGLLEFVLTEDHDLDKLNKICTGLHRYFELCDFKQTMKSPCTWEAYSETVRSCMDEELISNTSLFDFRQGMQWIHRFLTPFSVTDIPDTSIVHLSLAGFSAIPALIAKNKFDSKIALTEHGVYIRERLINISRSKYSFFLKKLLILFTECMCKFSYYLCDKIISVNRFNQKWELLYGADPSKLQVINNGVDAQVFVPGEKPASLQDTPTVVAMARLFELKDIETMIRSCALVAREIPNVQYLLYGDYQSVPRYTKKCRELISQLGLEDNFHLMGLTNNPEKAFLEGDISILTSISEGFPYTVLESMSCGIPVVSTDVGGVHEALTADCGILCKPRADQEIADGVIYLLKHPEIRKEMGVSCRKRVLNHFTINKFISEYQQIYENLSVEKPMFHLHTSSNHDKTREVRPNAVGVFESAKRANG